MIVDALGLFRLEYLLGFISTVTQQEISVFLLDDIWWFASCPMIEFSQLHLKSVKSSAGSH